MSKIVLNGCYGGFGLSDRALEMLSLIYVHDVDRTDTELVKVVEELGNDANDSYGDLYIVEIPLEYVDAKAWSIYEYDGIETLVLDHEKVKRISTEKEMITLRTENDTLKQDLASREQELIALKQELAALRKV
jgi:hypothetical protein